jgi:hypothetical protein
VIQPATLLCGYLKKAIYRLLKNIHLLMLSEGAACA